MSLPVSIWLQAFAALVCCFLVTGLIVHVVMFIAECLR